MSALLQNWAKLGATIGDVVPDHVRNGIPFDADNTVSVDTVGAVDHYHQGLPFTAEGRIAVTLAAPTSFNSGSAGFADGRLCVAEFSGGVFVHGNEYVNGGVVVAPLLGGAVLLPPINGAGVGTFPPAEIALTWADNPANDNVATSYIVIRSGEADVEITAPTTAYTDDRNLLPDTAYSHTLRTVNADGTSSVSAPINTSIPNLVLATAPTGLTASATWVTGNLVPLTWLASSAGTFPIASYNIYRNAVLIANTITNVLTFNVAAVLGVEYSWTVAAVDTDDNEGTVSAALVATFLPRQPNLHWDETGHVGAVPVTGWIDNIQALELVAAGAGDIEVRQQNGVDMLEVINFPTSMQPVVSPLINGDFSVILVGFMPPNQLSGNESLLDGTVTSVPTRLLIYTTLLGDIIVGQLGTIISGGNAVHAGQTLFTIVCDSLGANETTTYLDTVLQRVTVATGQFQALTLFADNNQAGNARAGAWAAELLEFDFVIDAAERTYWDNTLSAKWGI